MAHSTAPTFILGMLTALPLPMLLQRTAKYASVRASSASCIALKHESLTRYGKEGSHG